MATVNEQQYRATLDSYMYNKVCPKCKCEGWRDTYHEPTDLMFRRCSNCGYETTELPLDDKEQGNGD